MGPPAGKSPCNRTGNHRARFSRGLPPNVTRCNGVHRRARLAHSATPRGPLHQHGVTTVPAARRAATSCTGRGAYRPSWPEPRKTARRNKEHEGDARARARRAAEDAEVTEAQSRGSRPVRCVLRTRTRTEKAARRDKAQSETEQEQVDGASGVGREGGLAPRSEGRRRRRGAGASSGGPESGTSQMEDRPPRRAHGTCNATSTRKAAARDTKPAPRTCNASLRETRSQRRTPPRRESRRRSRRRSAVSSRPLHTRR